MSDPRTRARAVPRAALVMLAIVAGCTPGSSSSTSTSISSASAGATDATDAAPGSLVIVGRIVTMDEPPVAEALLIEDGLVAAVGTRDDVLALAGDDVPVVDIGSNVAYPGFIDAHSHWIGDRGVYGVESAADAMEAAITRGWTSISEQWNDPGKLDELIALGDQDAVPLRVDAYLALNAPAPDGQHFGDWYGDREPGPVTEHLRVQGLKITLDNGWGTIFHWEPAELTETIGRADEAGWQVSVHTVSTEAHDMVLDAFEAAIGPTGPNPLHHRIDHAIQVTDDQLARMVAMDLATVIHLDGAAADWVLEADYLGHFGPDNPGEEIGLARPLARLRGRRAARRGGDRRAVDLPGLRPDRRHRPSRGPDRGRHGRPGSGEPGDAGVGPRSAADRRAGAARRDDRRRLRPRRRGAPRAPGPRHARRRHDPVRRRDSAPPPTRSGPWRSSPRS